MSNSWLHPNTRKALYHRDGFACVYCQSGLEEGTLLSVDHIKPVKLGGTNAVTNLVTACFDCNSAKKDRTLRKWLAYLRATGRDTTGIARRIRNACNRRLKRRMNHAAQNQDFGVQ